MGPAPTPREALEVLVVDDDQDLRVLLADLVRRMGHRVETVESVAQATKRTADRSFDVLLLDWVMPGESAPELLRAVRARDDEIGRYTYVAVVTVLEGRSALLEALREGADDFFTKPVDPEVMEGRLGVASRMLRERRRLVALERLVALCSYCLKARDRAGNWVRLEAFLKQEVGLDVTHGFCDACVAKHFPDS